MGTGCWAVWEPGLREAAALGPNATPQRAGESSPQPRRQQGWRPAGEGSAWLRGDRCPGGALLQEGPWEQLVPSATSAARLVWEQHIQR